jgi:hypothetical protein
VRLLLGAVVGLVVMFFAQVAWLNYVIYLLPRSFFLDSLQAITLSKSMLAAFAGFLGGYFAARIARSHEIAVATFVVMAMGLARVFVFWDMTREWHQFIGFIPFKVPELASPFISAYMAGLLARRQRLKREAAADQEILDTF